MDNQEAMVDNLYDYSDIVVDTEHLLTIVEYYNNIYNYFSSIAEEDEKRNKRLKYDYQVYQCKKRWFELSVSIMDNKYNHSEYKSLMDFKNAIENDRIRNVATLTIKLTIDYESGNYGNEISYENNFVLDFKPYNIKFQRVSNHELTTMKEIEDNTRKLLNNFTSQTTIFNK